MQRGRVRITLGCLLGGFLLFVGALLLNYQWVSWRTDTFAYGKVDEVPYRGMALVLGTAPRDADGSPNLFFEARMDAAAELYHAGKVDRLLVSGSNDGGSYNEGTTMRVALLVRRVPEEVIVEDCAGFRTLDSIVRARDVFGLKAFTIVSQPFHTRRALYLAHHYGLDAIAYDADRVGGVRRMMMITREHFARALMLVDLYLIDRQPKTMERAGFVKGLGSL